MSEGYLGAVDRFLEIGDDYLPTGYEAIARLYGRSVREVVGTYSKNPVTL